jgi:ABC-type lipoprotein export system ATPase subunit
MTQKTKNSVPVLRCCISKTFPPKYKDEVEINPFNKTRLTVNPGDIIMLRGSRGVGKSTLIKIIGGLMEPSRGYVFWGKSPIYIKNNGNDKYNNICDTTCTECSDEDLGQEPLEKHDIDTLRGEKISFIFQYPNLVEHFTAVKNVAMPLIMRDVKSAYKKAEQSLELVHLEKKFWKKVVKNFSGGQKQSVNIARAFASEPELILADEPFAHLDDATKKKIWNGILNYKESRPEISMIIISHNENLINEQGIFSSKKRIATHICRMTKERTGLDCPKLSSIKRPDRDKPLKDYCPRCDKKQIFLQKKIGDVIIDRCPGCNGIWLDDGEMDELWLHMDKFMDEAVEEKVLRMFR